MIVDLFEGEDPYRKGFTSGVEAQMIDDDLILLELNRSIAMHKSQISQKRNFMRFSRDEDYLQELYVQIQQHKNYLLGVFDAIFNGN